MIEQPQNEEILRLIKELEASPLSTQRFLSDKLGISLGKTNYLLKELIKKGLIKIKAFSHSEGKMKKLNYNLTKKGFEEKLKLTYYFLKRKETEFYHLRQEWEVLVKNGGSPNVGEDIEKSGNPRVDN